MGSKNCSLQLYYCILICIALFQNLEGNLIQDKKINKRASHKFIGKPKKYLVIIPGFAGSPKRKQLIISSLKWYPTEDWDCFIFVHKPNNISSDIPCNQIEATGGKYVNHIKQIRPEFIIRRKYLLIAIHIVDVIYSQNLLPAWDAMHNFMITNHFDVLSPRVEHAFLPSMKPAPSRLKTLQTCPGLYNNDTSCDWRYSEPSF